MSEVIDSFAKSVSFVLIGIVIFIIGLAFQIEFIMIFGGIVAGIVPVFKLLSLVFDVK